MNGFSLFGQELVFRNYGVDDGLPTTEIHDSYLDINGYLWFATDRGLVRFDGVDFKVFTNSDGLENIVIFRFHPENNHKVWFNDTKNHIYWFDPTATDVVFEPYRHNEDINHLIDSKYYIRSIWRDSLDRFYFSSKERPGLYIIDEDGNGSINYRGAAYNPDRISKGIGENIDIFLSVEIFNKKIDHSFYAGYYDDFESPGELYVLDNLYHEQKKYSVKIDKRTIAYDRLGISDSYYGEEISYILFCDLLLEVSKKGIKSARLQSLGYEVEVFDNLIYVGTSKGVEVFSRELELQYTFLESEQVTSMILDDNKGLWVTTGTSGIFYAPSIDIHKFPLIKPIDDAIKKVYVDSNYVLITEMGNSAFLLNRESGETMILDQFRTVQEIFSRKELSDLPDLFHHWSDTGALYYYTLNNSALYQSKGVWQNWFVDKTYIYKVKDDKIEQVRLEVPKLNDLIKVTPDSALLATESGLYAFKDAQLSHLDTLNPLLRSTMNQIEAFRGGYLIGTLGEGVVFYEEGHTINLDQTKGLLSSAINTIFVENDSSFWVGSNMGLNHVLVDEHQKNVDVYSYTKTTGLIDNEINAIYLFNDTLYVASKLGVSYFHKDALTKGEFLNDDLLGIDSIKVDGVTTTYIYDKIEFIENQQVVVYLNQMSYYNKKGIKYQYKIDNESSEWKNLNGSELNLPNYESGQFRLLMRSYFQGDYSKPISLELKILTPWQKTWWAIGIFALTTLGVVVLLFIYFLRRIQNRKQLEIDKVQLELKALISQMNPHFTFNTINSIQNYIANKDSKEALNYLADFASLIRMSLDFAKKEFVTLAEEINFLKLYVNLENKRFGGNIDFVVNVNAEHDVNRIAFPALLLQPVIENAIVHGLKDVNYQGEITLNIIDNSDHFEVVLIDNGKGYKANEPSKYKTSASYGLSIIKDRIRLYNAQFYKEGDFAITNRADGASGTMVRIKLHKKNHH
ncbi:histidine kinase [Paracrocinitomix mangrovi]|uniref:sensor histidine kinase n=1 Tax=Paracrocinitomix mangrovi TaxID=2862509 RepID=UPI001C8DEF1E|nr:histidine kinase [Paracrocinitomix mangrovi]UKN03341.1 histidine kinase [Paracrocinitomix mangrovi]